MKLTLVRHTALQVSEGVCYGQSDIDVAASFQEEWARLKSRLDPHPFDAIYTSPLQRCVKLADQLGQHYGHMPIQDHRLMELHFGDWEMQAWDEIPRDIFDEWAQNYAHLSPPNGETFSQLQARGLDFIEEIKAEVRLNSHNANEVEVNERTKNYLLVTHGGMIRALLAHVLNMPLKGLFRIGISYASITRIDMSGAIPRVDFINR